MRMAAPLACLLSCGSACAQQWDFDARLDGKLIGRHSFVVSGPAEARQVVSVASFDVRVLGMSFYRYKHEAHERWERDCLRELRSDTDDDGTPRHVLQQHESDCVMSFAYWHPRMREQTQLLDPQTGLMEAVKIERLEDASLPVNERPMAASRWRLRTAKQTITVWYGAVDGRWIGLDAVVSGGRQLTYRLRGINPKEAP